MEHYFIGMDVGGTNLRCALVDRSGNVLERRRCASRIEEGRVAFCERVLSEISVLIETAGFNGVPVEAVGIGIPGLIGRDGVVYSSINMLPLNGFNLASFVEGRTALPTVCGNDANVIALGEQRFGAGRKFSSSMIVTIGTGLGSGLILDGKLWTGHGGFAAEFGHLTVDPEGYPCPCGNRGCLEQYVSAGAMVRFAHEFLSQDILDAIGNQLDAEMIAMLARNGNTAAQMVFDHLAYWLGTGLASLVNTLNLEAIIISGGVAASFDLLQQALELHIKRRCFSLIGNGLSVIRAELGDDAGLLGGAALAETAFFVSGPL